MPNIRRKIPQIIRTVVHLRDRFECQYCGRDLHNAKPGVLSVDHVVCYSHGGDDSPANLITACMPCNRGRGTKPMSAYATPGAMIRIRNSRRRVLNYALADALRRGETAGPIAR